VNQAEDQWRAAAVNPGALDALKRRLLSSVLYTLVPTGAAPPAWQRWEHPEGVAAVPCFLSEASARLAAGQAGQIVRTPGRDLFASLDSLAAWVDPDGVPLLILPAQLRTLMDSTPAPPAVGRDSTLKGWAEADDLPSEIKLTWGGMLPHLPHVTKAYWLRQELRGRALSRRLVLITEAGSGDDTARALDALAAALRAAYSGAMRIEAQAIGIGELSTAHESLKSIEPFYLAKDVSSSRRDTIVD
jgi:hypothetical protein